MWIPGWQELLILAFIVMLLFPKRLGSAMFNLGSGMKSFREGMNAPVSEETQQPATQLSE